MSIILFIKMTSRKQPKGPTTAKWLVSVYYALMQWNKI